MNVEIPHKEYTKKLLDYVTLQNHTYILQGGNIAFTKIDFCNPDHVSTVDCGRSRDRLVITATRL